MDIKQTIQKAKVILAKPWMKYVIAVVVFLVLITTLKESNIFYYRRVHQQRIELEKQKRTLIQEIQQDSINTIKLQKDINEVEKLGREKHKMKKDNEDIYIVKPTK